MCRLECVGDAELNDDDREGGDGRSVKPAERAELRVLLENMEPPSVMGLHGVRVFERCAHATGCRRLSRSLEFAFG